MKANIHFFLLNYDFSPEFAAAHHNGEPSENNRLYDWEDELSLTNAIEKTKVLRKQVYYLEGKKGDGSQFKEPVENMFLIVFEGKDNSQTVVGCSESILKDFEIDERTDKITVKVIMEENYPLSNPVPGIYIAANDFPKSLIQED